MGEQGEGDGFFGVRVDTVVGAGRHVETRQKLAQAAHEPAIVNAAAGGDDFARVTCIRTGIRVIAEATERAVNSVAVAIRTSSAKAGRGQAAGELLAELFAAGGLGRTKLEIGIGQHRREHAIVDFGAACDAAVAVVSLAAFGHAGNQRVDHHVAGARVERQDVVARGAARNHGDVGDAAEVQRDAADAAMAEQQVIGKRHQGSAMPAGGDIALAEIGDGPQAGALGHDRGVADLERAGDAAAEIVHRRAFVKNGLAVQAAQRNRVQGNAPAAAGFANGFGVKLAQQEVQTRDGRGVGHGVGHAQDGLAHVLGVGNRVEGDRLDLLAADIDDGDVDPVERGAAHDAGDSHQFFSSFWSSDRSWRASMGRSSSRFSVADAGGELMIDGLEQLDLHGRGRRG